MNDDDFEFNTDAVTPLTEAEKTRATVLIGWADNDDIHAMGGIRVAFQGRDAVAIVARVEGRDEVAVLALLVDEQILDEMGTPNGAVKVPKGQGTIQPENEIEKAMRDAFKRAGVGPDLFRGGN